MVIKSTFRQKFHRCLKFNCIFSLRVSPQTIQNWIELKFNEIRDLRPYLTKVFMRICKTMKDTRLTRDLSSLYFTPNKNMFFFYYLTIQLPLPSYYPCAQKNCLYILKRKERRSILLYTVFIYVLFIIKSKDRLEELCKTMGNSVSTLVSFCLIWINLSVIG